MEIKLEKSDIELIERVNEPRERKKKFRSIVKKTKHSKLRKTLSENDTNQENSENSGKDEIKSSSKLKYFLILTLIIIFSVIVAQIELSRCGLWATYNNNFNKIVHGDERYCHRELDPSSIIEALNDRLVNQDEAIKFIEVSLRLTNRERIISMIFTGPVGVGKTFASEIIAENFKWHGNINLLIFDMSFDLNLKVNESLDPDLAIAGSKFSACGFNLIVIDDVNNDEKSISRIAQLEREFNKLAKQRMYKIVYIVIFRGGERMITQDQMENFVIVEFQPFTVESFHECIQKHQRVVKANLSVKELEELKLLNFTAFGCKTVAKRMNLMTPKS